MSEARDCMSSPWADIEATPVPSPCTNVCRMNDASGWCEGCFRSIDEIVAWAVLDDAEKRAVWRQLEARRSSKGSSSTEGSPR